MYKHYKINHMHISLQRAFQWCFAILHAQSFLFISRIQPLTQQQSPCIRLNIIFELKNINFFYFYFGYGYYGHLVQNDFTIFSSNNFCRSCLSTFSVNSIANYLITILLIFLKKKMLNPWITLVVYFGHFLLITLDVNFSHKNRILF